MKKISLFLTIFFLISLTACSNFMNGSGLLEQITNTIDELNRPEVEVLIQSNQNWGNTLPAGKANYKVGKPYSIIFTATDSYLFVRWEAVNSETGEAFTEEQVTIEDIDKTETYFTLNEELQNVKIQPVCEVRPSVSTYLPAEGSTNSRDESIVITFSQDLSLDNDLSGITVSCVGAANLIGQNYFAPVLNGNQITITPDIANLLEVEDGKTVTVEVTVPGTLYYEKNGLKIAAGNERHWTFKVDHTTKATAEITCNVAAEKGSVTPAGTKNYNIGDEFELNFTQNEGYRFSYWNIIGADKKEVSPSVLKIEDKTALKTKVKVLAPVKGVNINPKSVLMLNVSDWSPKYVDDGVSRDSSIGITFNKEISKDNDLSKISITCNGEDLRSYYKFPTLTENTSSLTFAADVAKLVPVESGKEKVITVRIPQSFYYIVDGENVQMEDELSYSFKINSSTNDKAEISFSVTADKGSMEPVGSNIKYDIGRTVDLNYTPAEGFVFKGWNISGASNSVRIESIDQLATTLTVLSKGVVTVSPDVEFVPVIKKITPENTDGGVNVDSKIEIQFNAALKDESVNNFKNITISKYLPGAPQNKILLTSNTAPFESEYFDNPKLSADKKTLTITVKGTRSIFEGNEDTNKLYIDVIITENVKTVIEGNFAKVTHTYLVNQNKEKNVPEFYQMNLAKTETEAETGADSCFIKDKKLENFVEADFRRNHNKSFYFYCDVYDEESGVKSITIKESRVQDVDGNDIINPEVYTTTIDLNDDCFNVSGNGHVTVSKEYSYQNTEDGIIKLEFYAEDYAGNESRKTYEYYVAKDTKHIQNTLYITNEAEYKNNEYVYWNNPKYDTNKLMVKKTAYSLFKKDKFLSFYNNFKVCNVNNDKWYKQLSDEINNNEKTMIEVLYTIDGEEFKAEYKEDLFELSDIGNSSSDIVITVKVTDDVGNEFCKTVYMPNKIDYFFCEPVSSAINLRGKFGDPDNNIGDVKLETGFYVDYEWTEELKTEYKNLTDRPYRYEIDEWYRMHPWGNELSVSDETIIRTDSYYFDYYDYESNGSGDKLVINDNDKIQITQLPGSTEKNQISLNQRLSLDSNKFIDWSYNIIGEKVINAPYKFCFTAYILPMYDYGEYKIYGKPYSKQFSSSTVSTASDYQITFNYTEPASLGPNTGMTVIDISDVSVTKDGIDVTSDFNISYLCTYKNNNEVVINEPHFIIPSVTELYANGKIGVIIESKNGEQKFKKTEDIIFNPLNNFPITSEHSYAVYNYDYTLRYRGNASFYIPLYQQMSNGAKYLCLFNLDPYNPTKLKNYDEDYYSFNLENASDDDYGEWEQTVDFYYCWIPCTTDDVELPNYPESYLDSFSKIKGVFDWIPVSKDYSFLTNLPDAFKSLKLYADSYDLQDGKYYLCVKIDDKLNEYLNLILDTDEYDESINNYMYKCLTYVDFTSVPRMYEFNDDKLVIPKIAFGDSGLQNKCHIVINQLNSSKWKFEPIVDSEISLNTLTNSFEKSISLTTTNTFYRVNVNAYTQRTKDVNDLKSKYDNTENEVIMSPFYIFNGDRTPEKFTMEENNNYYTVYSKKPSLIQVISSNVENGYGSDIDKWERFGKEEYVTQASGTNNYYIDDMKNKIQYGQYYVIIVTAAHGERAISKVYKK